MSNAVISDFEVLLVTEKVRDFLLVELHSLDYGADKGRLKKQMVNEVRRAAFSSLNSAVGCMGR